MIRGGTKTLSTGLSRRALLVLLFCAVPFAYYAGGVYGFAKGYSSALFAQSGNAGPTVLILRKLRASDTATALDVLEHQLDDLLVQNSVYRVSFRSSFNLPRLAGVASTASIDKSASSALVYRAEFPSTAQPPLKAAVDGALAQLAKRVHEKH